MYRVFAELPILPSFSFKSDLIFQLHQDLNRSYKEVCAPVIERCHFLFNELRPAIGNEINALSRSRLLKSTPRWKDAISKVIHNNRKQKCK